MMVQVEEERRSLEDNRCVALQDQEDNWDMTLNSIRFDLIPLRPVNMKRLSAIKSLTVC